MSVPLITPLTDLPSIADPSNFDARADNLITQQFPRLVNEINDAGAAMDQAVQDAHDAAAVAVNGTSATNVAITAGAKNFTVLAGHSWSVGGYLQFNSRASPSTHWIIGQITAYNATLLTIAVIAFGGSGSRADWNISLSAKPPDLATPSANGLMSGADKAKLNGLDSALAAKAPLLSPALTGSPTAPTAAVASNSTQIATTAFVKLVTNALISGAPGALDTLAELAAAMGNDPNFSATVINQLTTLGVQMGGKLANNGGSFSGGYNGAAGSVLSGTPITPALSGGHLQTYTAPAGSWTISAPVGSGYYDLEILVTNPAGGSGVMTPSGFTFADVEAYKAAANGRFRLFIAVRGSQKFLNVIKASG